MNQFNKNINVDGEELSFRFSQIYTVRGVKFFIVVNKNKSPCIFDMQKNGFGIWKIIDPAPQWVRPLELQLATVIIQNL